MKTFIVVVLIVVGICWIYSTAFDSGKKLGSRKGYGVGYDRGRGSGGCLFVLMLTVGIVIAAADIACRPNWQVSSCEKNQNAAQ